MFFLLGNYWRPPMVIKLTEHFTSDDRTKWSFEVSEDGEVGLHGDDLNDSMDAALYAISAAGHMDDESRAAFVRRVAIALLGGFNRCERPACMHSCGAVTGLCPLHQRDPDAIS